MNKNYISWDEYFMGVALLSAKRSKDPNTTVGACIVNPKKRIVGIGYNGLPYGCKDELFPWDNRNDDNFLNNKYPFHVYKKKIFFLRIAQYYMILGGFFNSLIGCFATIDNPCINI